MTTARPRVGIVGVGRMGANIGLHLRDVGYAISAVFDSHKPQQQKVAGETGAASSPSLAEVTRASDVILTVVSDDGAMDHVFAARGDSLLSGAEGKVFINAATLSPAMHRDVERRAETAGASSIEASMASSIPQARDGKLFLMAAGKREVFERVRPLLEDMSAQVRYIGPAGSAASVKALVNMVMNENTAALAEGLGLAQALGLDLTMVREVFGQTGAASRVLETDGLDMQDREHDVYFSAAHAAKDSNIALALAREVGLHLPLAQATARQYERLIELGSGELDKSAVAELTFLDRRGKEPA